MICPGSILILLPIITIQGQFYPGVPQPQDNVDCAQVHEQKHLCKQSFEDQMEAIKDQISVSFQNAANLCLNNRASQCIAEMQLKMQAKRECRQEMKQDTTETKTAIKNCYSQFPNLDSGSQQERGPMIGMPYIAPNADGSYTPRNMNRGQPIGLPYLRPDPNGHYPPPPHHMDKPYKLPESCRPVSETEKTCMRNAKQQDPNHTALQSLIQQMHQQCGSPDAKQCIPRNDELCNCLCQVKQPMKDKFRTCMMSKGVVMGQDNQTNTCTDGCRKMRPPPPFVGMPNISPNTDGSFGPRGNMIGMPNIGPNSDGSYTPRGNLIGLANIVPNPDGTYTPQGNRGGFVSGVPYRPNNQLVQPVQPPNNGQQQPLIRNGIIFPQSGGQSQQPYSQSQSGLIQNRPYPFVQSVVGQTQEQPFSQSQAGQVDNRPMYPTNSNQAPAPQTYPYPNTVQGIINSAQNLAAKTQETLETHNNGHPINYHAWRNWGRNSQA